MEYQDDDREDLRPARKTESFVPNQSGAPNDTMADVTTQLPENQGGLWTAQEETALLEELATTQTIEFIARIHNRTPGAIRARQNHLARRLILEEGVSLEDAAKRVRQPVFSIEQTMAASQKSRDNVQQRKDAGAKKEESLLSVMIDVRELLRQMVANQAKLMNSIRDDSPNSLSP
jgi:hypothetical protein